MKKHFVILVSAAMALSGCGDDAEGLGRQIDRMGRAAVNTALNQTFSGDADVRGASEDAYNKAKPSKWDNFTDEVEAALAILDSLDGDCGNQLLAVDDDLTTGNYATLAGILIDDQIYVNSAGFLPVRSAGPRGVSPICTTDSYLGVEGNVVAPGEVPPNCGGRSPSDDVIRTTYSLLAAGDLEGGIDDGIESNDGGDTDSFPFLSSPFE